MASEGRGILSPVRLPVPPLQQVYDSFEFTADLREAHCNGSPGVRDIKVETRAIPLGKGKNLGVLATSAQSAAIATSRACRSDAQSTPKGPNLRDVRVG